VAAQGDTGFPLLTGTDSLLVPYLQAGARGTICSSANVVPDLVLAVYQAATSGKLDEALGLAARLRAVQAVFRTGSFPAAYKAVIAATGIGGPGLAPPRQPLDEEQTAGLIKRLTALDVL
jgi:4-hydroxy-tetrahydrodipicolinate synthase